MRRPDQKVRFGFFFLPTEFDRLKISGCYRFRQHSRHFDTVRQQKSLSVMPHKYRRHAVFAAEVDTVRSAAGEPCKIVLGVQENTAEAFRLQKLDDPLSFRFDLTAHAFY